MFFGSIDRLRVELHCEQMGSVPLKVQEIHPKGQAEQVLFAFKKKPLVHGQVKLPDPITLLSVESHALQIAAVPL